MKNIVVLISGRGSNIQAIVNVDVPNANIAAVLDNNEAAAGLAWAAERGIATGSLNRKNFGSHPVFDQAMMEKIDAYQPDLVILAGFMCILTPEFCAHYENHLINIHPSILPSFADLHTRERVSEVSYRVASCTIHFIAPELDCGPIISQGIVSILDGDTADDVAVRVLTVEHRFFPQAVADFAAGRLGTEDNRVLNAQHNAVSQSLLA